MNKRRKQLFNILLIALVAFFLPVSCKKDKEEEQATVKDIDGNTYHILQIGTQSWFQENLKVTKLNDGTAIPIISSGASWGSLTTAAFCWYDNNQVNGNTYGALYNWHAVKSGKLCPQGWHVPSDADWTVLIDYLGGVNLAGGKLKATSHWMSPNTGATNESGFTALPGGHRNDEGNYLNITGNGFWWSSSESGSENAWRQMIFYHGNYTSRGFSNKASGLSVRCVKN
jgi:uncharacterized protein (TIGR02145 family)